MRKITLNAVKKKMLRASLLFSRILSVNRMPSKGFESDDKSTFVGVGNYSGRRETFE